MRALAGDLGISPATVHAAYRDLRRRGLVVSEGSRGVRVSRRPPVAGRPALVVPEGVRDLCNGNPDPSLLPPLEWALGTPTGGPHLYGRPAAFAPLLDHAAADFEEAGIDASARTVVSGALDGIERLLSTALHTGDYVLVEDPTYAELLDLLRAMGLAPVGVPVDARGPLTAPFAAALSRVRAAVITPRAHNPTGVSISESRASELRQVLADRPDVLVVENDNSALVAGAPHIPVAPAAARWAVVRSVSKALSPDLRLATMAGDPGTIALVEGRQRLGAGWVSHILQQIAHRLWSHPGTPELIARAAATYTERRAALIEALGGHGIPARGASGVNVYVEVQDEGVAAQALLARGWAVRAGAGYRLDTRQSFLRVTTAALPPPDAVRLAEDLAGVLQGTRGGRGA